MPALAEPATHEERMLAVRLSATALRIVEAEIARQPLSYTDRRRLEREVEALVRERSTAMSAEIMDAIRQR